MKAKKRPKARPSGNKKKSRAKERRRKGPQETDSRLQNILSYAFWLSVFCGPFRQLISSFFFYLHFLSVYYLSLCFVGIINRKKESEDRS